MGERQAEYFKRFARNGIKFCPIDADFVNSQNGTTINYLWFRGADFVSGLGGYDRNLDGDGRAFWVIEKTSEAGQNSKVESYSPEDISKVLKKQRISGLEKQILEGLRQ